MYVYVCILGGGQSIIKSSKIIKKILFLWLIFGLAFLFVAISMSWVVKSCQFTKSLYARFYIIILFITINVWVLDDRHASMKEQCRSIIMVDSHIYFRNVGQVFSDACHWCETYTIRLLTTWRSSSRPSRFVTTECSENYAGILRCWLNTQHPTVIFQGPTSSCNVTMLVVHAYKLVDSNLEHVALILLRKSN